MKKIITLVAVAALAVSTVSAQTCYTSKQGYTFPANEISISYGRVSMPGLVYTIGGAFGTIFSGGLAKVSTMYSTGAVGFEYQRYVHPYVALGGIFTYEDYLLGFDTANGKDEDGNWKYVKGKAQNHHVMSIMPAAKFKWFSREHASMYSKVAVGVAYYYSPEEKYTAVDGDGNVQQKTIEGSKSVNVAFQATPVGVDFGGSAVRGFAEVGFGYQGIVAAGLRFNF